VALLLAAAIVAACAPADRDRPQVEGASAASSVSAAQRSEIVNGNGLLWRIDVDGRPPSYLFGTVHLPDPRVLNLPPPVRSAMDSATVVGFENVVEEGSEAEVSAMMLLEDGRDLESIIGPDLFEAIYQLGEPDQDFEAAIRSMKPWAAALALQSLTQSPTGAPVLDDRLEMAARDSGKRVIGLETARENLGMFDALPDLHQIDLLRLAVYEIYLPPEIRAAEYEIIVRDYLARDTGALLRRWSDVMDDRDSTVRDFESYLLFGRSRLFVNRMAPWLDEGNAFFAVGSAHLPGEDGMVTLLRQRGYAVSRVY